MLLQVNQQGFVWRCCLWVVTITYRTRTNHNGEFAKIKSTILIISGASSNFGGYTNLCQFFKMCPNSHQICHLHTCLGYKPLVWEYCDTCPPWYARSTDLCHAMRSEDWSWLPWLSYHGYHGYHGHDYSGNHGNCSTTLALVTVVGGYHHYMLT